MSSYLVPYFAPPATTGTQNTVAESDQQSEVAQQGSWDWGDIAGRALRVVVGVSAFVTIATAGTPAVIVAAAGSVMVRNLRKATDTAGPFSPDDLSENPIGWRGLELQKDEELQGPQTTSGCTVEVIDDEQPALEYKPAKNPPTAEETIAGLDYVDRNQAGGLFAKWTVNWLISSVKSNVAGHTFSARVQNLTARFLDCFSWGLTKERLASILQVEENEFARLLNRRVAS